MIKNIKGVNEWGQISGRRRSTCTTHYRIRQGLVGCTCLRRGDSRRGRCRTCARYWAFYRTSVRLQLLIPPIWQLWRVLSSEDQRNSRFLRFLIWFEFFFGRRRLCLEAIPAYARRPVETGPEERSTTWMGRFLLSRFPSPCRSAQARVISHPSSRKFAILWAAVAPAVAMSLST